MFGGSHYPRTPEWLASYADEMTQQVGGRAGRGGGGGSAGVAGCEAAAVW
jgi:hypothetical protein